MTRPTRPSKPSELDIPGFESWLKEKGATLYDPYEMSELVRYRWKGDRIWHIVFRRSNGRLSYLNKASADYDDFIGLNRTRARKSESTSTMRLLQQNERHAAYNRKIAELVAKSDGRCWYCNTDFSKERGPLEATKEHVLAKSKKGFDSRDNIVLTHKICNWKVGTADVGIKRAVRAALRKHTERHGKLDWDAFLDELNFEH